MTTQPPDTAAAIKEIQARHEKAQKYHDEPGAHTLNATQGWCIYNAFRAHRDRAYLLAQLTEALKRNEGAVTAIDGLTTLLSESDAQLTAANERAERATAEAAVLLDAAQAIFDSGHNGNLYAAEYNALDRVLKSHTPLAAAHLSEYRRLVEGQRTHDALCVYCDVNISNSDAETFPCGRFVCPVKSIRAGVKP